MAPTPPHLPKPDGIAAASNGSSSETSSSSASSSSLLHNVAQALRDLSRGEQTAAVLEESLSSLESKLDGILASFGAAVSPEEPGAAAPERKGQQKKDANGDDSKEGGGGAAAAADGGEKGGT
ncbi:d9f2a32e-e814-4e29-ba42-58f15e0f7b9b [Thermothielavioides terrestris]|uniref:Uncharacterized protein n=2 Tax=Thermothielavioides terrestris TaxID=2587410 RepID=G2RFA1_THETT|nr:uncharacterized protein THITE_2121770 [Thermothielavioides terrestris NRRL 8126]AEO70384.1 hypothetical protein THITE_2121770 [Thermothielavioides terrestris NRRL 8126]SPQ18204.1 d9f2a32e-e814-4e29-ba42-58f15e0f7b9b [Thermothielavioides terrestris]